MYSGVLETEGNFWPAHESGSGHGKLRICQLIRLRGHDEIVLMEAFDDIRPPLNYAITPLMSKWSWATKVGQAVKSAHSGHHAICSTLRALLKSSVARSIGSAVRIMSMPC